jgi:hypothetical protein
MDNSHADNYQAINSQADNSQIDNEGFLDLLNVGSGELNWSGTQYCSPIGEQETVSTPDGVERSPALPPPSLRMLQE